MTVCLCVCDINMMISDTHCAIEETEHSMTDQFNILVGSRVLHKITMSTEPVPKIDHK